MTWPQIFRIKSKEKKINLCGLEWKLTTGLDAPFKCSGAKHSLQTGRSYECGTCSLKLSAPSDLAFNFEVSLAGCF